MDALRKDNIETDSPLEVYEDHATLSPAPGKDVPVGTSSAKPRSLTRGRKIQLGAAVLALSVAGAYGWHWWTVGRFLETTDDAYLQADKVIVSPRIAGYMSEVLAGDNQPVKAGDVLARLDDREYRILVKQAEADAGKTKAQLEGVVAAIIQQQAQVEAAAADVKTNEAALTFSTQEFTRYQDLMQTGAGSVQRQQQADSDLRQRRASLDKAKASLSSAQKQVESLKALAESEKAALEGAEAKLDQARLNLSYTAIVAPISGVVGDRSLRAGQFVSAGTNLLTLVPMGRDIYLIANYKETQVGEMAEGQAVSFTVDAFSGHEFKGHVSSFAPGTGAQFALLPPENATGNFTKVAQRVPVRIVPDESDPLVKRLRPGLSVEATVYTGPVTGGDQARTQISEAQPQ